MTKPVKIGRPPTHGHGGKIKSRTWQSWRSMRDRCTKPGTPSYYLYGGRGITFCDRWSDFANFLRDMGERPEGCSIDRIDSDGNYDPSNCRWATSQEQADNRRNTRRLTFRGETKTVNEWTVALGFSPHILRQRLQLGWPVHRALSERPHR